VVECFVLPDYVWSTLLPYRLGQLSVPPHPHKVQVLLSPHLSSSFAMGLQSVTSCTGLCGSFQGRWCAMLTRQGCSFTQLRDSRGRWCKQVLCPRIMAEPTHPRCLQDSFCSSLCYIFAFLSEEIKRHTHTPKGWNRFSKGRLAAGQGFSGYYVLWKANLSVSHWTLRAPYVLAIS
jgi:hypothetical protein